MLLRCKCPGCGTLKEYVAEEVGSTADCLRCGQRFVLQPNHGRAVWQIAAATLAVLLIIGGIGARIYLRVQRYEARREAFQNVMERREAVQAAIEQMRRSHPDDDDDDK
jgi:hypothetical protein